MQAIERADGASDDAVLVRTSSDYFFGELIMLCCCLMLHVERMFSTFGSAVSPLAVQSAHLRLGISRFERC